MNDARISSIFTIREDDRARYGNTGLGNSLILARNLFQADAGTRFVLVSHGGWDHHGDIYKEKTRNHPVLIRELDLALANVIRDLDATPSRRHGLGLTMIEERARLLGGHAEIESGRDRGTQVRVIVPLGS